MKQQKRLFVGLQNLNFSKVCCTVNSLGIPRIFYSTCCPFHDTIKIYKKRIYIYSNLVNLLPKYMNFTFKNTEVMN